MNQNAVLSWVLKHKHCLSLWFENILNEYFNNEKTFFYGCKENAFQENNLKKYFPLMFSPQVLLTKTCNLKDI